MSVKAFKKSPAETVETIRRIHEQLLDLKNSLSPRLQVTQSPAHKFASESKNIGAYYLHCGIYGSLMAAHMILFYPWMSVRFGRDSEPRVKDQTTASAEVIAHSARQIILVLRLFDINVATPAWLAFYYPMYAYINLFVHTLIDPNKATAQSDLALLDVCVGHFGHLEHVTSGAIAFSFPRESAALAAKIVRTTRRKKPEEAIETNTFSLEATSMERDGRDNPSAAYSPVDGTFLPATLPMREVRNLAFSFALVLLTS